MAIGDDVGADLRVQSFGGVVSGDGVWMHTFLVSGIWIFSTAGLHISSADVGEHFLLSEIR